MAMKILICNFANCMRKFLNSIFYGFYLIDYALKPQDRLYDYAIGSILFAITLQAYVALLLVLICLLFCPLISNYIDSTGDVFAIIFGLSMVVVTIFDVYWTKKEMYLEDFRAFDKEPEFMKWALFIGSVTIGILGIVCLFKSGFWLNAELTKYLYFLQRGM